VICFCLIFFLWVGFFHQLVCFLNEKEIFEKKEIAFFEEKQEFERKNLREKLKYHYFFNLLEYLDPNLLINHHDDKIFEKITFVLYYIFVDVETKTVELEKEMFFYNYYIDVEKLRHQKNVSVNFNVLGQVENLTIIPFLFEPLIGNAVKHTKQDGTGWVDIVFDVTRFPIVNFYCKNNYACRSSNIVSSKNGLKLFEEHLELYYKNNHTLKIIQSTDLYEVELSIKMT